MDATYFNNQAINSQLFDLLVKKKTLQHPTAAGFNGADWVKAAEAIDPLTNRDSSLLLGALYFGRELSALRTDIEQYLMNPFTRENGAKLLSGMANEQLITLRKISKRAHRRQGHKLNAAHIEMMTQTTLRSANGQQFNADDQITHLVDSIPHWIYHLWKIPAETKKKPPEHAGMSARRAFLVASIERGLRDLWHSVVWQGHALHHNGTTFIIRPSNYDLDQRWLVWHLRDYANMSQEVMIDATALFAANYRLPPVVPALNRTVVNIERLPGRKRKFVIGRANGLSREQRKHVTERDMLERIYTGIFLDIPLPKFGELGLTCRELSLAWWVLSDLASLMLRELEHRNLESAEALATASLPVKKSELEEAIASALSISKERSNAILNFFSCDPNQTSKLFSSGLWTTPLLPVSDYKYHIVTPPLLIGSPRRRIEAWLDYGGISDQRRLSSRGKPFEANVRKILGQGLAKNHLITDYFILPTEFKRTKEGEEIDLLIRIGRTVIVGEVKCFLAPVEPMDRYNYVNSLNEAVEQARRKSVWIEANRIDVLPKLDGIDCTRISEIKVFPIVILNQGYGFGLGIDGVAVSDLHFLSLLFGSGDATGDVRVERGSIVSAPVRLYSNQDELEKNLYTLLTQPYTLERYAGKITWINEPFPSSDGGNILMEFPRLTEQPSVTPWLTELVTEL